jgi:hypothetical protein
VEEELNKKSDDEEEFKKDINNIQDKGHEGIRKDISAGQEELKKNESDK